MGKIPVGRTIARGYGFLAGQLGTVLGLGWLPAAFYAAAAWFCLERMGAAMQLATPSSAAFNQFTAVDFLALLVATALLVPTVALPFTQAALGLKQERVAAHFVFGMGEARLFLALLRFFAVVIAVLAALAFACQTAIGIGLPEPGTGRAGFAMPVEWYGIAPRIWLEGAAACLLSAGYLFLKVRLGFFLPASAAAEEKVTLGRAWVLSRGNSWRLAIVSLAIATPAVLVLGAAVYAIEGDSLGDVLRTAWSRVPSEGVSALYRLQYDHALALAGVGAVALVVMNALFAGASAAAYQTIREAAEAPEVSHTRAEPEFSPAMATADPGPRWRNDPFAASEAAFARRPPPAVAPPPMPVEPAPQSVPETIGAPADRHAYFTQTPAAEPEPLPATDAPEIVAPAEQAETLVPVSQTESEIAVASPEPIAREPADTAPPLDPAGMAAAHDQITPPPAAS